MSLTPGYTAEQIVEHVLEYMHLQHGTKQKWLRDRGIGEWQMKRWRSAYLGGDVALGLVPRHPLTVGDQKANARIRELERQVEQLRAASAREIDEVRASLTRDNDKLRAENAALLAGTTALGKAIGFLQDKLVQEPVISPSDAPGTDPIQ